MAKASVKSSGYALKPFTDCMYFINGHCKLNDKCQYRHCQEAAAQTNNCFKWPATCRNVNCHYRHPAPPPKTEDKTRKQKSEPSTVNRLPPQPPPQARQEGLISFFWDIENVPIPKAQKPFDIVHRIRQKLVVEVGLREYNFTCYCNTTTISQENQLSLFHANVRINHVPDRKPGAVDRQIMLELDRFERAHRPPATIVLISGDIDFVGKLSDLRHQAGFHVIVIHNKPAKSELKATVNAHYPWELFTQPEQQSVAGANRIEPLIPELTRRAPQSYRLNTPKPNDNPRRVEPSPIRSSASAKVRPGSTKKQLHSCPKCTNEFESIQALRQHQEVKDHLFDCPICDETFTTLDGQTQHQKAKGHYEAEYICGQCSRRFAKFDSLYQHQQATGHNGFIGPAATNTDVYIHPQVTHPSVLPKNNQNQNDIVQDTTMLIMQQGIEALAQFLPKMFPTKK